MYQPNGCHFCALKEDPREKLEVMFRAFLMGYTAGRLRKPHPQLLCAECMRRCNSFTSNPSFVDELLVDPWELPS